MKIAKKSKNCKLFLALKLCIYMNKVFFSLNLAKICYQLTSMITIKDQKISISIMRNLQNQTFSYSFMIIKNE